MSQEGDVENEMHLGEVQVILNYCASSTNDKRI